MPTPYAFLLLGVLVLAGLLYLHHWRHKPKIWFGKIGVSYAPGAVDMAGLSEAMYVLREVIARKYPKKTDEMLNFWLEIRPAYDVEMTTHRIDSFTEPFSPTVVSPEVTRVVLRQVMRGGKLKTVGASDLFHEVAEHVVPHTLGEGWNDEHDLKWYSATREMERLYRIEMGGAP